MIAAMNVLSNFEPSCEASIYDLSFRRVAILGDMLELGSNENKKHTELVQKIVLDKIDVVHCIGLRMKFFHKRLPIMKRGKWVKNVQELSKMVKELIKNNDVVMLKGSNGLGLTLLLKELKAMGKSNVIGGS